MGITRRSLLQLMVGAAAGTAVTPLPWKLLDDASIWTQNWFLVPKLVRKETTKRLATCGLCGGSCGVRVRMLGDVPIAVNGQPGHPISHGGSCPIGLSAPQLRFHPCRIVKPVMREAGGDFAASKLEDAMAAIGKKIVMSRDNPAAGTVAILDWRPGSAMSKLYLDFLDKLGGGHYVRPPGCETARIKAFGGIFEDAPKRIGYDFENARTVLSFGAPLFEGWNSLGRMAGVKRLWNNLSRERRPRFFHAESNHSTTASMADKWLAIRPGSEAALALGLGHVLLKENLVDSESIGGNASDLPGYQKLVDMFEPKKVSELTGLDVGDIVTTARTLARETPSVAVVGGGAGAGPLGVEEETAVMGLNLLLGSYGKAGGVLPLAPWPPLPPALEEPSESVVDAGTPDSMVERAPTVEAMTAKSLDEIPDGSVGLLLVDGSMPDVGFPERLIRKKLAKGSMTVSLNPYLAGPTLRADVILPASVLGEWECDIPTPTAVARNTYSIAAKLTEAPPGTKPPPDLVALLAKAGGIDLDKTAFRGAIEENLKAILVSGRGQVFDPESGKTEGVDKFKSADELREALVGGGCWVDEIVAEETSSKYNLLGSREDGAQRLADIGKGRVTGLRGKPEEYPLLLMPFGKQGEAGESALPQIMTKLYRESGLRELYLNAHINPETATKQRLLDHSTAELKTPSGSIQVEIVLDRVVMPGVVRVAVAPSPLGLGDVEKGSFESILDITEIAPDFVWRLSRASLEEVRRA